VRLIGHEREERGERGERGERERERKERGAIVSDQSLFGGPSAAAAQQLSDP